MLTSKEDGASGENLFHYRGLVGANVNLAVLMLVLMILVPVGASITSTYLGYGPSIYPMLLFIPFFAMFVLSLFILGSVDIRTQISRVGKQYFNTKDLDAIAFRDISDYVAYVGFKDRYLILFKVRDGDRYRDVEIKFGLNNEALEEIMEGLRNALPGRVIGMERGVYVELSLRNRGARTVAPGTQADEGIEVMWLPRNR